MREKAERLEREGTTQGACQSASGLLERPLRFLPGAHAKPIIAASERELRETMRARMNIAGRLFEHYLTAEYRDERFGECIHSPATKTKAPEDAGAFWGSLRNYLVSLEAVFSFLGFFCLA